MKNNSKNPESSRDGRLDANSGLTCSTCGKLIGQKPYTEILSDHDITRIFCINCVNMGYSSLQNIRFPTQQEMELMIMFGKFIRKASKRRTGDS